MECFQSDEGRNVKQICSFSFYFTTEHNLPLLLIYKLQTRHTSSSTTLASSFLECRPTRHFTC